MGIIKLIKLTWTEDGTEYRFFLIWESFIIQHFFKLVLLVISKVKSILSRNKITFFWKELLPPAQLRLNFKIPLFKFLIVQIDVPQTQIWIHAPPPLQYKDAVVLMENVSSLIQFHFLCSNSPSSVLDVLNKSLNLRILIQVLEDAKWYEPKARLWTVRELVIF